MSAVQQWWRKIRRDVMDRIRRMANGVGRLIEGGLISSAREELALHEVEILERISDQLMMGITGRGEDIRPYYSEDPYFRSRAEAEWYIAWKAEITPNPRRNRDAPNLFINGKFHSELIVRFGEEQMLVEGETVYAAEIVAKYGLDTFGLTDENLQEIIDMYVRPTARSVIQKHILGQ